MTKSHAQPESAHVEYDDLSNTHTTDEETAAGRIENERDTQCCYCEKQSKEENLALEQINSECRNTCHEFRPAGGSFRCEELSFVREFLLFLFFRIFGGC